RILIGTRKGTFIAEKSAGKYQAVLSGHAGVGVPFVTRDPNTGYLWAALGHGPWGAKLSRSRDGGKSWEDAAQAVYPQGARYIDGFDPEEGEPPADAPPKFKPARLLKLWVIA